MGVEIERQGSGVSSQAPEEVTGQPRRVVVGSITFGRTFSALRHRNFRLFFAGQLISLMGTWMQNTAQSWFVYQLTGSKVMLGAVAAAGSAPMLFLSVYGGSLADRHSKKRVLLITQAAMMVCAFILAGLTATRLITPMLIIIIAALSGAAMAFDMPTRQSFLIEITSRDDLLNAVSLNSALVNSARVAGPAVAGLAMAHGGVELCFFLNGVSFLAVLGSLLLMRVPRRAPVERKPGHIAEGFRFIWNSRRLRIVFSLFAVVGIFGWSYSVLLPAFARDILNLDEKSYGSLLGANGFGALMGALTTATFGGRFPPRQLAFTGLYVFSAALALLSLFPGHVMSMASLAVAGWGMMLFFSTINTVIQTSAPDEMRGRVMGIWALVFGGMTPIGSLQAGALSQRFGVLGAVQAASLVCAAAGVIAWLFVRNGARKESAVA